MFDTCLLKKQTIFVCFEPKFGAFLINPSNPACSNKKNYFFHSVKLVVSASFLLPFCTLGPTLKCRLHKFERDRIFGLEATGISIGPKKWLIHLVSNTDGRTHIILLLTHNYMK
jgi:hypothetical protein